MIGVSVQLVEAGDLVIDLVHELCIGHPENRAGVGEADARIDMLGHGGGIVCQTESDSGGNQSGQNTKNALCDAASTHNGTGQHKAPVVPDIYVQGTSEANNDQQNVQGKDTYENQGSNGYGPGKGASHGPTNIDDVQAQVKFFYQTRGDRADVFG